MIKITSVLVLFFIGLVYSQQTCLPNVWYLSEAGDYYYDLSNLGNIWLNATDTDGNTWYVQICSGEDDSDYIFTSPCQTDDSQEEVAVCVDKNGEITAQGNSDFGLYADSPDGSWLGYEIIYGAEKDTPIKTAVEFSCGNTFDPIVTVNIVDETITVITVSTTEACPTEEPMVVGIDPEFEESISINFFFILILSTTLCCCACMCLCYSRQRKVQVQKDIAMKQFSSVAFQPIPHTQTKPMTKSNMSPSYNPYVVQPMFYIPQNGVSHQFPFVHPHFQTQLSQQAADDEILARELQAKFDQEARN